MRQYLQLDRLRLSVYLGLLAAACRSAPGPVVPVDAAPVSSAQIATWVGTTVPSTPHLHRFKWLFQDERASIGGRGSARIAPPDSLRFDAAGPFGSEPRAAAVVGETPLWVEPPDALTQLVPNYSLLWAMFGIARLPDGGAELRGVASGDVTAWRYAEQADTVEYVHTRGTPSTLVTVVRHAGDVVGRAEATLGPDGAPLKSKLTVPSVPAKLDLTFLSTTRTAFAPEIWLRRTP